jgi:hypothetical protein
MTQDSEIFLTERAEVVDLLCLQGPTGAAATIARARAATPPAPSPPGQTLQETTVPTPQNAPAADRIVVPAGTTGAEAVEAAKLPTNGPKAIVVVRAPDGTLKDLTWAPDEDVEVEPVPLDSPDGLDVLRHSTAHVLAQAVQSLHPDAKLGIGPPIENGFYYDFGVEVPFVPEDLAAVEGRMKEIIKTGQRFRRRRFASPDEAKAELADEPYKLELIDDKGGVDTSEVMEVGGGLVRPVPRPAPADDQAHHGVQAAAQRRRVLARQREEPAAPAHLRHGVADARRDEAAPPPAGGGAEARPPPHRRADGAVHLQHRDRQGPTAVAAQRHDHP